jgi:hypothetical protein
LHVMLLGGGGGWTEVYKKHSAVVQQAGTVEEWRSGG